MRPVAYRLENFGLALFDGVIKRQRGLVKDRRCIRMRVLEVRRLKCPPAQTVLPGEKSGRRFCKGDMASIVFAMSEVKV